MSAPRSMNVLFLCTGNTARSILAEGLLRHYGAGRFTAFSAGSQPKGVVNPFAVKELAIHGIDTSGLRSKTWNEFAGESAPRMDFVFTVCDNAAGEACPLWPGQPISGHWGIEDPAAVEGTDIEKQRAFNRAYLFMQERIQAFVALPLETATPISLRESLDEIGRMTGATTPADRS